MVKARNQHNRSAIKGGEFGGKLRTGTPGPLRLWLCIC